VYSGKTWDSDTKQFVQCAENEWKDAERDLGMSLTDAVNLAYTMRYFMVGRKKGSLILLVGSVGESLILTMSDQFKGCTGCTFRVLPLSGLACYDEDSEFESYPKLDADVLCTVSDVCDLLKNDRSISEVVIGDYYATGSTLGKVSALIRDVMDGYGLKIRLGVVAMFEHVRGLIPPFCPMYMEKYIPSAYFKTFKTDSYARVPVIENNQVKTSDLFYDRTMYMHVNFVQFIPICKPHGYNCPRLITRNTPCMWVKTNVKVNPYKFHDNDDERREKMSQLLWVAGQILD
jgi:hypothetical protein